MSKMSELSMILDEMISAGNTLVKTANALKDFYSTTPEKTSQSKGPKKKESPKKDINEEKDIPADTSNETKTYTYEEVRKICAGKSAENDGAYKRQVLEIVKKYADGKTLSKVAPSQYAALVAEVEVIGNAG